MSSRANTANRIARTKSSTADTNGTLSDHPNLDAIKLRPTPARVGAKTDEPSAAKGRTTTSKKKQGPKAQSSATTKQIEAEALAVNKDGRDEVNPTVTDTDAAMTELTGTDATPGEASLVQTTSEDIATMLDVELPDTPHQPEDLTDSNLSEDAVMAEQETAPRLQKRKSETGLEDDQFVPGQNRFLPLAHHDTHTSKKARNDDAIEEGMNTEDQDDDPVVSRQGADGVVVISACSVVSRSIQKILFSRSQVRAPYPPESNTLDTFRVLPLPMSEPRETQPPFRNMIKLRGYPPLKSHPILSPLAILGIGSSPFQ